MAATATAPFGGAATPRASRADYRDGVWIPHHNPWAIALTVTLATFMEVLDTSIANVSLPHIAGDLSATQDEATWVLTSYLVANAIVLPISGWIASKVGRKRFYMASVALFTTCSLLCGLAPSLGWLVFFRVMQGVGGGGLAPSEQAILADTFSPAKRGSAMAIYGMAVVMAPAIGPTLGGFITDNYSWRWVFLINVPVGILSLLLSNRMVEDPPHLIEAQKKVGSLDFTGLGLLIIGLASLEVVLDKGQEEDWFHSNFIVGFSLAAVVGLVAFVLWTLRSKEPLVDLRLFKNPNFAASNAMMLMLGVALYGTTVLLPQFIQVIMHWNATTAGMALSPGAVLIILMMPIIGRNVSKVDARKMIAFGFTLQAVALLYMAKHLSTTMDFPTAVIMRCIQSTGLAFLFVPIQTIVYNGIPPAKNNSVSGMVNLSRNMGGDLGITLVTTVVIRRAQMHQAILTQHATLWDPAFRTSLAGLTNRLTMAGSSPPVARERAYATLYDQLGRQASTLGYVDAVWVVGIMCALMVPLVFLTKRNRGGMPAGAH
jgi:MFS transporter, DHA2 family, multidrug resistance protein